jgi:hypothetical protein
LIADVIDARPDAARVLFEEYDLPCVTCEVSFHETIEVGVAYRGLDADAVVARLNQCPLAPAATERDDP